MIQVLKKDGTLQEYNDQKIINAVNKSASRALYEFKEEDYCEICNFVYDEIEEGGYIDDLEPVSVSVIHSAVEKALLEMYPDVGECYREYRNYKLDFISMMDKVYEESQKIMYIGDKENSNTDSAIVSTKRSLIYNELNKELYRKFFLTTEERQAINDGYIYIHDMNARRDCLNCCLFNVGEVMQDGFEMGNVWYNEPNSLDTAFDVIGDITLSAASQQYGGFTLPEIDKVLEPYAEKSYQKYYKEYENICIANGIDIHNPTSNVSSLAKDYAMRKVQREMEQGYQGWEYKFNTVASSRGDYPFITITFGLGTTVFAKMASKTFLRVHREGQGKKGNKKPVLFPKLVFLYTKKLHGVDGVNRDLFEEGVLTSSKTMYPDWLSLDNPDTTIGRMYQQYGRVISPMGK